MSSDRNRCCYHSVKPSSKYVALLQSLRTADLGLLCSSRAVPCLSWESNFPAFCLFTESKNRALRRTNLSFKGVWHLGHSYLFRPPKAIFNCSSEFKDCFPATTSCCDCTNTGPVALNSVRVTQSFTETITPIGSTHVQQSL